MYAILVTPEIFEKTPDFLVDFLLIHIYSSKTLDNTCIAPLNWNTRLSIPFSTTPGNIYWRLLYNPNYLNIAYLDCIAKWHLHNLFSNNGMGHIITAYDYPSKAFKLNSSTKEILESYYCPPSQGRIDDLQEIQKQLTFCKSFDTLKLYLLMALPYLHQYNPETIIGFIAKYNETCYKLMYPNYDARFFMYNLNKICNLHYI